VKLTRPTLAIALMTACIAMSAGIAYACPDDPERCVERGATVSHRSVAVTPATATRTAVATPARATTQTVTPAPHKAPAPAAPSRKAASKPARTVSPAAPAPPTPGMGMLLKLSNGSGGEVSLFPNSKPNEKDNAAGVSWVL
jgi:hypothetical protein